MVTQIEAITEQSSDFTSTIPILSSDFPEYPLDLETCSEDYERFVNHPVAQAILKVHSLMTPISGVEGEINYIYHGVDYSDWKSSHSAIVARSSINLVDQHNALTVIDLENFREQPFTKRDKKDLFWAAITHDLVQNVANCDRPCNEECTAEIFAKIIGYFRQPAADTEMEAESDLEFFDQKLPEVTEAIKTELKVARENLRKRQIQDPALETLYPDLEDIPRIQDLILQTRMYPETKVDCSSTAAGQGVTVLVQRPTTAAGALLVDADMSNLFTDRSVYWTLLAVREKFYKSGAVLTIANFSRETNNSVRHLISAYSPYSAIGKFFYQQKAESSKSKSEVLARLLENNPRELAADLAEVAEVKTVTGVRSVLLRIAGKAISHSLLQA